MVASSKPSVRPPAGGGNSLAGKGSMRLDGRLLGVVLTAAVLAFTGLGQGVLRSGDEARFAVAARDVLRGGSWVIPSTLGEPMLIKPPLYIWLVAAAGVILGRLDELAARVPGALAMVVTAAAVYRLGVRLFGPPAALLAGLFFSTALGPALLARDVLPDMPMTMALTLAMLAAVAAAQDGSRRAAVGFAAALALAFHFKLLAGLVPPVATVLVVAALRRDWAWLGALRPALGLVVFLALLAPWLVRFLLVPDFLMLVDTETLRGRAWTSWYSAYLSPARALEFFVETSLPWIVLAPVAAGYLWRRRATLRQDPALLPLVWLAVVLALNMGIHTVRWRYLLPALPPAALVLARAWSAEVEAAHGGPARWISRGPLALLLAGFALLGLLTVARVPIRLWDTDLPALLGRLPWILVPLGWTALGAAGLGLLGRRPRAAMGL